MVALVDVLADLEAEGAVLDALVAGIPDVRWATPTPAPGWSIAHQIGHLTWTDKVAGDAASDPAEFDGIVQQMRGGALSIDSEAEANAALPPAELLQKWRDGRRRLAATLLAVAPGVKLPWFGPPMSATSMATARIMETWAHGQDIADALGETRQPTSRLRHIAHLAVRTRNFAFTANGLTPPDTEFRITLTGPDGDTWTWGPGDAQQSVKGTALDFCLLATQRVHRDDTGLVAVGPDAQQWLGIAQVFAGRPGAGRPKRSAS